MTGDEVYIYKDKNNPATFSITPLSSPLWSNQRLDAQLLSFQHLQLQMLLLHQLLLLLLLPLAQLPESLQQSGLLLCLLQLQQIQGWVICNNLT